MARLYTKVGNKINPISYTFSWVVFMSWNTGNCKASAELAVILQCRRVAEMKANKIFIGFFSCSIEFDAALKLIFTLHQNLPLTKIWIFYQ